MCRIPSRRPPASRRRSRRSSSDFRCQEWTTWWSLRSGCASDSNLLLGKWYMARDCDGRIIFSMHLGSEETRSGRSDSHAGNHGCRFIARLGLHGTIPRDRRAFRGHGQAVLKGNKTVVRASAGCCGFTEDRLGRFRAKHLGREWWWCRDCIVKPVSATGNGGSAFWKWAARIFCG